jgi:hypothetical protein
MREVVQTQQRRDEPVVDQALSVLDATQACHDGKDMGQEEVGGMVVPVIVIGPANRKLKEVTNCKCATEGLKQTEASKAGEAAFFEGEIELSRAFGHASQTYLKSRFVRSPIYIDATRYSYASTATR